MPTWPFPAYRFLPGRHPHPEREGGYRYGRAPLQPEKIDEQYPEKNEHFCFALDLFNHRYFWESHVYFEALWNAESRQGDVATLLKVLIKLAAAEVKFELGQVEPGLKLLENAQVLLKQLLKGLSRDPVQAPHSKKREILGFDLADLRIYLKMKSRSQRSGFKKTV